MHEVNDKNSACKKLEDIWNKQTTLYEEYLEKRSPRLNLLDEWKNKHENSHSRVLTKLLNPKAEHSQGDKFLKLFLKQVGLENLSELDLLKTKVLPEEKRIDISLELKGQFFIIIENKIDAGDQKNQLARYYKKAKYDLKYKEDKIHVLYLTKYGHEPEKQSLIYENINIEEKVKCISYSEDILQWLDKCKYKLGNENNTILYSALVQYEDTIKGLVKKREGMKKMQNNMIKFILEQFTKENSENGNSVVKIRENSKDIDSIVEIRENSKVILKNINDAVKTTILIYDALDIFFALHEKYESIKEGITVCFGTEDISLDELIGKLGEESNRNFFLKINRNPRLSIEFSPADKNYKVRVGILQTDYKEKKYNDIEFNNILNLDVTSKSWYAVCRFKESNKDDILKKVEKVLDCYKAI